MRKIVVILITGLTFILYSNVFAQLGTGANFLKMGVGSRQLGMGSAFTGVGDDLYTIYWNPGGLGHVRWWEVSAMYNSYFADMYYGALTGVKQFRILGSRKTTAGIGLFFHGMPEWDSTDGTTTERGSANNIMAVASFGQRLDWLWDDLSVGLNVKVGRSALANYDAWAFAADFGIMYQLDLLNRPFQIGAAVQNIGYQTAFIREKSPIPLGLRLGASYRFLRCDYHNLLLAADISKYKYGNLKLGLGAEYWFLNLLAIRSGYIINQKDVGDLSFGVSVKFDAFNSGFQTDYNRSNYGEVFNYNNSGTVSLFAVNPEPFRLLSPAKGGLFCHKETVKLAWEEAPDPDHCDIVRYRILIDPDMTKVEQAITAAGNAPASNSVLLDLIASENELILPQLDPNNYSWTAIAVDRKGHRRWCEEIWTFTVGAPDLIIRDLTFLPSDTLPDLHDNYQGAIKITIENRGLCPAYNFKVVLSDSFCCEFNNFVADYKIDSLLPRQTIDRHYTWWTDLIGKHHFTAVVDEDNQVVEMNESNNWRAFSAITIPRGKVVAEKDTLVTKMLVFNYSEIPILDVVFFDKNSSLVKTDYYQKNWIQPVPLLRAIADSLTKNKNLTISLSGYIDPYQEKDFSNLARERMQNVYSLLVDTLNVAPQQVLISKANHDITAPRIRLTPDQLFVEENMRVEIRSVIDTDDAKSRLFSPIYASENPQIDDGLKFYSTVKANLDIVSWQLQIRDRTGRTVLYRTPIRIEPGAFIMHGETIWVGIDEELRLVGLNNQYTYSILVQDQLGRYFVTAPKKIFIQSEFAQDQNLYVFLNKFNSPDEYYHFDLHRLQNLAHSLIKSPTMRMKFNGYACEIGSFEYNLNLAQNRADKYRNLFLKLLKEAYQSTNNPSETWEQLLSRVDANLSKNELAKKFEGYPGNFAEPLKYCRLCSLKEYIFPMHDAYGRNLSRRVDAILYRELSLEALAKERQTQQH